jgi:hypothetical protein
MLRFAAPAFNYLTYGDGVNEEWFLERSRENRYPSLRHVIRDSDLADDDEFDRLPADLQNYYEEFLNHNPGPQVRGR